MLFDTPIYILFLCLVVVAYWRLGFRNQNRFLLGASYLFYGWWDWRFLLLMIGSTVIDYLIAIRIADTEDPRVRKSLLALSLVINFSILGFFKYFNFFADSLGHVLAGVGIKASLPVLLIILPPGISFYTFQEVAYIVDVYSGKLPASRSFLDYGLFISLFPHLIAGPDPASRAFAAAGAETAALGFGQGVRWTPAHHGRPVSKVRDCRQLRAGGERGICGSAWQA